MKAWKLKAPKSSGSLSVEGEFKPRKVDVVPMHVDRWVKRHALTRHHLHGYI